MIGIQRSPLARSRGKARLCSKHGINFAAVGAITYVLLETVAAGATQHWMLLLGVAILLTARLANRGLYGRFLK